MLRSESRGFTLIELMVVVLIVAILATLGVTAYLGHLQRSQEKLTYAMIREVSTAVQTFILDEGRPPRTLEELVSAGYLTEEPLDAWEQPFVYRIARDLKPPFNLLSAGADGELGTEDDIDFRIRPKRKSG